MKQDVITNIEQEAWINQLEKEWYAFSEVYGRQTGEQNQPVTQDAYRVLFHARLESEFQSYLDENQQRHLPVSGAVIAFKAQNEAKEKIKPLQASKNDDEIALQELSIKQKRMKPRNTRTSTHSIVTGLAVLLMMTEFFFIRDALRFAGFSKIAATAFAISIAAAIGFGIHFFAKYIVQAKTALQRSFRFLCITAIALAGFVAIGRLRTHAVNEEARLHAALQSSDIQPQMLSPTVLIGLPFIIFLAMLFFSIRSAGTEEDSQAMQEYEALKSDIKKLRQRMKDTQKQIKQIGADASQQAKEALANWEHAASIEKRLASIAKTSMALFAENNTRHRSDGQIPSFFIQPPHLSFTFFFSNLKNPTQ